MLAFSSFLMATVITAIYNKLEADADFIGNHEVANALHLW